MDEVKKFSLECAIDVASFADSELPMKVSDIIGWAGEFETYLRGVDQSPEPIKVSELNPDDIDDDLSDIERQANGLGLNVIDLPYYDKPPAILGVSDKDLERLLGLNKGFDPS